MATIKRLIVLPFKKSILDGALHIIDTFGNIGLQGDSDCQRRRQGRKLYFRDVFTFDTFITISRYFEISLPSHSFIFSPSFPLPSILIRPGKKTLLAFHHSFTNHILFLRLTPAARLALVISYSVIIVIGIVTNLAILAPFLNNKVILTVTNDNPAKHFRSQLGCQHDHDYHPHDHHCDQ